jgi:hypothetical protein
MFKAFTAFFSTAASVEKHKMTIGKIKAKTPANNNLLPPREADLKGV